MARLIGTLTVLTAGVNAIAGATQDAGESKKADPLHPRVKMATTLGDIVLELDAEKAPITVMNFIQYVEDKFYDGTIFHRVMSNFMIQGGGFTQEMDKKTEGLRAGIKNEWKNGLKNKRGTIAMARGGRPDTATSQFFINVVDNTRLDRPQRDGAAYAVFGKVAEGMDTVDKIRNTKVQVHSKYPSRGRPVVPVEPVVIKSVRLISEFDRAKAQATVKATEETRAATDKQTKTEGENKIQEIIKKAEEDAGTKAVKSDTGLVYIDLKVGDGPMPQKTDRVEVHYTGWLLDGTKFDSSVDRGTPFPFSLTGGVIKGWLEGVATMKVGGKRKLIIPPDLAYGAKGRPSIPPDSTLVFEVELLSIK